LASGADIPDYYILEYSDWVNAVLVTAEKNLVLIRIYRHGLEQVHYELPGGCVDAGEEPLAATIRECLEETGYRAKSWRSLGECCANPATHTNKTHLFLGEDAQKVQQAQLDETEEIVTRLVPLKSIPGLLDRNEVISASHALALFKACRYYKI
jgi:8-oxo-dGTP pyrophosphatase MutT (NUDIX family)